MSVSKDKKRGTWFFFGAYRDIQGKKHQYKKRGFKTKKEAKEAEHAFLVGATVVRPSITLDELVLKYRADFPSLGVKESTLISGESYYQSHIKEYLGSVQIAKLTVPVITQWLTAVSQKKQPNGEPYAVRTINKAKEVLSKYLTYAVRLGFLEYNPARSIAAFKRAEEIPKDNLKFWEISTFQYFISTVDDPYWSDVFTFLFQTGVREGELFALQWSDIDLGSGRCHICKTITNKTKDHTWKMTSPKTRNSIRYIDLQDSLLALLRRRYASECKKDGFDSSYFVFGDKAPLSRNCLATHLDKYIKNAGVPRITPHGFRHSHASYLIRSGKIDDQLIADRLGHTVEEMRHTYAHIYEESRGDLKKVLNDLF